jgi:hypothetical protein
MGDKTTPQAKAAQLAVQLSENEMRRTRQAISDIDTELGQIAAISAMQTADPGTTTGRISAVAANAEAREFALKNMAGEAVFKPLFEGLLTAGSEQQRKLSAAQDAITTDIGVFQNALKTQDITPQQQVARNIGLSQALTNVQTVSDPALEVASAIKQVRLEAEKNFTLGVGPLINFERFIRGTIERVSGFNVENILTTPEEEARIGVHRLESLITESQPIFRERTPEEIAQVETLRQQIIVMQDMLRAMQANTEEVRKNNAIMQQDVQTNNTGTIQRQQEQRK